MTQRTLWDRWDEVDRLFERALDRPSEERESFVVRACEGDDELLEVMRSLLHLSAPRDRQLLPGGDLLKAALGEVGERRLPRQQSLVGRTVGPYRLSALVGLGGMGDVYRGERVDGLFERQVAVKVLREELHAPGVAERFELERRILASLSHPGIAQLIDGGLIDRGRPFLVMEYVEGTRIDRYADGRGLGVEARIRLIMEVADAVEYAHRHMVVHRDLKPSNILVTREGRVKLLDFGIAKLLEMPEDRGELATTRPEARFVTPEYAAPEQLLGERVSTQTDVYALTALLYELLTGVRPYTRGGPDSVLERVIQGAEPTAPSEVVARVGTAGAQMEEPAPGPGVFASRGTTPDGLRRQLGGDLDAILLRGLRSRPTERYGSVEAFRDDLQRHLDGQAVTARGDLVLYRARKFARRHRVPVASFSAAFLVATGSAVGLALQRSAVVEERNRAEAAAAAQQREAETARQVTGFLVELFRAGDPREGVGDTVTVRTLLARGAARVDEELAGQPAVRADLLDALGQVYTNLGSYLDATLMFERSVALRRDSIPGQARLASSLRQLGDAHREAREFTPALAAYGDAIEVARATGEDPVLADAHLGMAATLVQLERLDSAEVEFREGLRIMGAVPDRPEPAYLDALTSLAGLVRRRGDLDGASDLYQEVLARYRTIPEADSVDLSTALNNLAVVRRLQGRLDEAESLYRESLRINIDRLGPGHPTSLLTAGNLARVLFDEGKYEEGIAVHRSRVEGARERWPEGHWRTGDALMQLGASLIVAGRPEEALAPLSEAVDLMMIQVGPYHSWTNVYRGWLGTAAALTGRQAEAQQLFEWSLEGLSSYQGLSSDNVVKGMLRTLVDVMEKNGLVEQARRYRRLGGGL